MESSTAGPEKGRASPKTPVPTATDKTPLPRPANFTNGGNGKNPRDPGSTAAALPVSNDEFIEAIFGNDPKQPRPWVTSVKGNPKTAEKEQWIGQPWRGPGSVALPADTNNYLSTCSFKPNAQGVLNRTKENFHALHWLLCDDVGTKVQGENALPPTWILESSPGNYQYGYALAEPVTDVDTVISLVRALIAAKHCDPGASSNRTQFGRLPVGVNGKHAQPFATQLRCFAPGTRYTVDQLVVGLGLKLLPVNSSGYIRSEYADADEDPDAPSDNSIMGECSDADNFQLFNDLCAGRWQDAIRSDGRHYPSQNEADNALMQWFARYTRSDEQVVRLFMSSRLADNLDRKWNPSYYIRKTLEAAREQLAGDEKKREAAERAEIELAIAGDEPTDLFSPPKAKPLDLNAALPQELAAFARVWGDATGHDSTGYAYAVLPVLATALNRYMNVVFRPSWTEAIVLWTGLIGISSSGKSPTLKNTVRLLDGMNNIEIERYRQEREAEGKKKGLSRPSYYIMHDTTIEALQDIVASCDHGVLRHVDEGTDFLNGMGKYANAAGGSHERAAYLTAWNGGPYMSARMTRNAEPIKRWGINLVLAITPTSLTEGYAEASQDGMLARMLMYELESRPEALFDSTVDTAPQTEALDCLVWAFANMPPRDLRLSPEASEIFEERVQLYRSISNALSLNGEIGLAAVYGKAGPHLGRIAAVFELTSSKGMATVISGRSMLLARAFMAHAVEESERLHKHVFGRDTPYGIATRCAIKILTAGKDRIERASLIKVDAFDKAKDHEKDATLRLLRDHKWLLASDTKRVRDGIKFSDATAWTVNPKVHDMFRNIAEQERARAARLLSLMTRAKKG